LQAAFFGLAGDKKPLGSGQVQVGPRNDVAMVSRLSDLNSSKALRMALAKTKAESGFILDASLDLQPLRLTKRRKLIAVE
jgi:hypothetical protein